MCAKRKERYHPHPTPLLTIPESDTPWPSGAEIILFNLADLFGGYAGLRNLPGHVGTARNGRRSARSQQRQRDHAQNAQLA